jgi:acyl-CoA thioester hydrolase
MYAIERKSWDFRLELVVRDYECDVQGIVNNAVYLNYLEHARHRHLLHRGVDFVELAGRGLNLVLTRIELDYIYPLRTGDRFTVGSSLRRVSRLRFGFRQGILLEPAGRKVLEARILGAVMDAGGRPVVPPPEIERLFEAEGNGCVS